MAEAEQAGPPRSLDVRFVISADDLEARELRFWPIEARDFYEERAAIMEFDGGLTREAAEEMARDRTVRWWRDQCKGTVRSAEARGQHTTDAD